MKHCLKGGESKRFEGVVGAQAMLPHHVYKCD